jgi:hypothetical protein
VERSDAETALDGRGQFKAILGWCMPTVNSREEPNQKDRVLHHCWAIAFTGVLRKVSGEGTNDFRGLSSSIPAQWKCRRDGAVWKRLHANRVT